MNDQTVEKRICLGAFAGAHGVRGEALVKTFTQSPETITAYGPVVSEDGKRAFWLEFVRETKPGFALVRSADIESREDALSLKGTRLYVNRDALPEPDEDEFYMEDLVGLRISTEDEQFVGVVSAVHNFGAGDLLEVKNIPGRKGVQLIEFSKENVPIIEIQEHKIVISSAGLAILRGTNED